MKQTHKRSWIILIASRVILADKAFGKFNVLV
jgi:hypothetical protein